MLRELSEVRSAFNRFAVADADTQQQVLSESDCRRALWKLGLSPLAQNLHAALVEAGASDYSAVTWQAFKQVYFEFHKGALDPLRVVKRFLLIDTDRRGVVTQDELTVFLGGDEAHAQLLWHQVASKDDEGVETISCMEFSIAMVPGADVAEVAEHIKSYYRGGPDHASLRLRENAHMRSMHITPAPSTRVSAAATPTGERAHTPVDPRPPTPPPPPPPVPEPEPPVEEVSAVDPPPPSEPTPPPTPKQPEPEPEPERQEEPPAPAPAPAPAPQPAPVAQRAEPAKPPPPEEKKEEKKGGCCVVA